MKAGTRTALYALAIVPEKVIDVSSKVTRPIRHHVAQARILAVDDVVKECPNCSRNAIIEYHTWSSQDEGFCDEHRPLARKAWHKNHASRKER